MSDLPYWIGVEMKVAAQSVIYDDKNPAYRETALDRDITYGEDRKDAQAEIAQTLLQDGQLNLADVQAALSGTVSELEVGEDGEKQVRLEITGEGEGVRLLEELKLAVSLPHWAHSVNTSWKVFEANPRDAEN